MKFSFCLLLYLFARRAQGAESELEHYADYFEVANDETETKYCFTLSTDSLSEDSRLLLRKKASNAGGSYCCQFPIFTREEGGKLTIKGANGISRCLEAGNSTVQLGKPPCSTKYSFNSSNLYVLTKSQDLCLRPNEETTRLVQCKTISPKTFRFIHGECEKRKPISTAHPKTTLPSTQDTVTATATATDPAARKHIITDAQMTSKIGYRNRKLVSGIYKQLNSISLVQCMQECLRSQLCQSANYKWTSINVCELSSSKTEDAFHLTEVNDYIYYAKLE